jgi:hypothetical protein
VIQLLACEPEERVTQRHPDGQQTYLSTRQAGFACALDSVPIDQGKESVEEDASALAPGWLHSLLVCLELA